MTTLTKQVTHVDSAAVKSDVKRALAEDIGSGDITAQLVANETTHASIISREAGVLCGVDWFTEVFAQIDSDCKVQWNKQDGDNIQTDDVICEINGNARALLSGERTALNFLQTLSGTATTTAHYVAALKGTACRILDTRKTIPGMRLAQKYAVHCGGGVNHRNGLYDMVLIKENHIAAAGSIALAVKTAQARHADVPIEVEVETLDELAQAINARANRILLDNMSIDMLQQAVALAGDKVELEASGNITLETIADVASTGVHFISLGALTKHVRAIDFSMRIS